MKVILRFEAGRVETRELSLPLSIGRGPDNALCLRGWRVARHHARLERRPHGIFLEDLGGLCGSWVNGARVSHHGPLASGDQIVIGECLIQIVDPDSGHLSTVEPLPVLGLPDSEVQSEPAFRGCSDTEPVLYMADPVQESDAEIGKAQRARTPVTRTGIPAAKHTRVSCDADVLLRHRKRIHLALLHTLDLRRRDIAAMSDTALRAEVHEALKGILASDTELPQDLDKTRLLTDVLDEAVGLGPLEPLLADPRITEIMVNRHDQIYVEINGRIEPAGRMFSSEQAVLGIIERIVSPLGRRIDDSSPMVDARLPDGSRVNAVISPVALRGCSLTIRKFPERRLSMTDLVERGSLDTAMSRFLEICVRERCNIVVSGGTGSGKTTLLNVLSNCIPAHERVITIEDAAELRLNHEHCVALEARPANLEGRGRIEIRDLVRNALRMRPDRIVVGECRGGEAFDMLSAMNTGHEGSLTTLHANTPRDALARLETMILMAGMDLPLSAVREHIAASIHFIVQQARLGSGQRVITAIVEVTGMESGRIQLQPVFRCANHTPLVFEGCGLMPEHFSASDTGSRQPADLQVSLFQQRTVLEPAAHGFLANTRQGAS